MSKIIGIDISKQTFDVSFRENEKWEHQIFENNQKGFKALIRLINQDDWVVMEASGTYYFALASYLFHKKVQVCVENPLVIKRFSQMMLYRAKTDKKDSKIIAEYGMKNDLKLWKLESENNIKLRQLYTRLELIIKQIHQNNHQLESYVSSGCLDSFLEEEIKKDICYLEKSKEKIEQQMLLLSKAEYGETLAHLESIPGVGPKTAMMMALITDNFKKFDSYKQLIAYIGFSPRIYKSGSSVRGKGHICKMGKSQLRKLLYLCSWSAKRYNKSCKEMYDRLKAKGKPERLIKVAIANKLIKQIFAIGKSSQNYNENICI